MKVTCSDPIQPAFIWMPKSKNYAIRNQDGTYDMTYHDAQHSTYRDRGYFRLVGSDMDYSQCTYDNWVAQGRPIMFAGAFNAINGYGYQSSKYVEAMSKVADIYTCLLGEDREDNPNDIFKINDKFDDKIPMVTVMDDVPGRRAEEFYSKYKGIYTMWETDTLPRRHIETINSYDFIIVPSQAVKKLFKKYTKKPIYVVNHGVDIAMWSYHRRPKTDVFTFGTYGQLTVRKGTESAVEAFRRAFPLHLYPNLRFEIKTSLSQRHWSMDDPRIIENRSMLTRDSLLRLLHSWNATVFATRGEGFGLPIIESIATGCPTIATNWSGQCDFLNDKTGFPVKYTMEDVNTYEFNLQPGEIAGKWAYIDTDDLAEKMLWVYNNYEKALDIAEDGAKFVDKNFNWDDKGKEFVDAIDDFLKNHAK